MLQLNENQAAFVSAARRMVSSRWSAPKERLS